MRKTKFRGKSVMSEEELKQIGMDKSGWIYGNLIMNGNKPFIVGDVVEATDEYLAHAFWMQVIPESVGQYIGLEDKNGVEYCEGDVLGKQGHWSFYIGFKDACFVMIPCNPIQRANWTWHPIGQEMIQDWEIIGNIYENPELLDAAE